jgi:hypothetical protein
MDKGGYTRNGLLDNRHFVAGAGVFSPKINRNVAIDINLINEKR